MHAAHRSKESGGKRADKAAAAARIATDHAALQQHGAPTRPGGLRLSSLATTSRSGGTGSFDAMATSKMASRGPQSPAPALTPGSARKRTFDTLMATDTPPLSPARTHSTLSAQAGGSNSNSNSSSGGAPDLADAYRPTLYAAFLANVFVDSTDTPPARTESPAGLLVPGGKRSPTQTQPVPSNSASYAQLIAQLRLSTHSRPSGSASLGQLGQWLSALTHHVSKLDHRNHAELVEAVLAIPWPTLGPAISRAWMTFVCSLLSARAEWLGAVLEHSVRALGYHSEWHELPLSAASSYSARSATRRQVYTRVHALLRSLLSLIPTLPTTLFPLLLSHLPPKRSPVRTQGLYVLNLLRVTEYAPELTEGIWAAVVHRVMSIDVEVQMEVEDLEDEQGRLDFLDGPGSAPSAAGGDGDGEEEGGALLNGIIVDILDRPLSEEDADDADTDSELDPSDAIGNDILNDPAVFDRDLGDAGDDNERGTALDELSSGDDSSDSDAEDAGGPPKSAAQRRADEMLRQQEAVRSIKRNVKKLDVVMQILYECLRRTNASYMGLGPVGSGYFEDAAPVGARSAVAAKKGGAAKSASAASMMAVRDRMSDEDDDDLLMAAGPMDEDDFSVDTPLGEGSILGGAGSKLRRVGSSTPSASLGAAGAKQRGSIPLFEPTPSPSPGLAPSALPNPGSGTNNNNNMLFAAHPARRTNLFHTLLGIFDRLVLPTFRSRHVQFVMFWFSSLDAEYADTFLGMLLSKSLYSGPGLAAADPRHGNGGMGGGGIDAVLHRANPSQHQQPRNQHTNNNNAASPILRKAAASYVASLVSRASFIGTLHTRAVVLNLCAFLDAYLEQYTLACAHAQACYHGGGRGGGTPGASLSLDDQRYYGQSSGATAAAAALGPPAPGSPVHDVFYSIAQALFYIFCFRWRDLELSDAGGLAGTGDELKHSGGGVSSGSSFVGSPPSSSAALLGRSADLASKSYSSSGTGTTASGESAGTSLGSVAAHFDKANGFGPSSLASYSHASSSSSRSRTSGGPAAASGGAVGGAGNMSASFSASSREWCDGLDVVQRVITSSLNPLRYCSPTVVRQFAYVAKVTGLVYCYSIIEANNRIIGTASDQATARDGGGGKATVSMTASGTLKPLQTLSQARDREDTPTRTTKKAAEEGDSEDDDDDLPQPVGSERLDGFFPFDPYRLQNSMGFVDGLYRQWEDVAPEANDDDEDGSSSSSSSGGEDDDDDSSSSESGSDSSAADDEDDKDVQMRSGAVPIPRRAGSHSSSEEGSQRFAQSLEAMSLSPNPSPFRNM